MAQHKKKLNRFFIKSIRKNKSIEWYKSFPDNLPIFKNFEKIDFTSKVVFLVGENGSGKSTFLETIASGLQLVAAGSHDINRDPSLAYANDFSKKFYFARTSHPSSSMFFRAEDFFGFIKRIQNEVKELEEIEKGFENDLTGYGLGLAKGAIRGQKNAYQQKYGENPDGRSHGESFFDFFENRLVPDGLYLMDEPEMPLSPVLILKFISLIYEKVKEGSQFIIATHSPILMAFPNAQIIQFKGDQIESIAYKDIEHVSLTRDFLNNHEYYLEKLLGN